MDEVKPGWYQHWKGEYYFVVGRALNTETQEIDVFYRNTKLQCYTRPESQWFDLMGEKQVQRFTKIEGALTEFSVKAS